jgi:hypothetical protein
MNDDDEFDIEEIEPHVQEVMMLMTDYECAPIDSWASVDLSRLVALIDIELQLRAP